MKLSLGPKLFFAAALALTLALKLLVYHQQPVPADPEVLGKAVAAFLIQHGFEPHLEKRFGAVFIDASAGKCRMLISQEAPQGWDHSRVELQAKRVGRLRYVFDGMVYANEPFLAPMIDNYLARVRVKVGLSPNRHPIFAVAASDDCAIEELPWWELSMLS